MNRKPTVFVVDDDEAVRNSISWMLRKVGLIVESFDSPRAILDVYDPTQPGCLVLDLRLPGMNGLELRRRLAERGGHHPFVMVTGHGEVPDVVDAMKLGAIDFIEKPYRREQLLDCVRQALESDARSRRVESKRRKLQTNLLKLSNRERQILTRVVAGNTTNEIGRSLALSPKTVEVHRSNIARKMKVASMAELIIQLARARVVAPRPVSRKKRQA